MEDIRFTMGVLTLADTARFLGLPRQTLSGWARTGSGDSALLHVLPGTRGRRTATVPFIAVVEAHVLNALRDAGVRPQRIQPALQRLRAEFGPYVLVAPELATDGIDVLWDFSRSRAGEGLIAGHTGQRVIREIVQDHLRYVAWDGDDFPVRLRLRRFEPFNVAIDPGRFFGQPYFVDSGVRVADVAGMLAAEEDPAVVAGEFGLDLPTVRATARVALGRAA